MLSIVGLSGCAEGPLSRPVDAIDQPPQARQQSPEEPAVADPGGGQCDGSCTVAGDASSETRPGLPGTACSATQPQNVGPPEAYFVAAGAGAGGDGSLGSPFATLEEARDAIRALARRPAAGIDVYLRGGTYQRQASFALEAQDSGAEDAPVRYRAYGCEVPRLVGGVEVSDWELLESGAVHDRLPAVARGKVYVTDLAAQGVTDYGTHLRRGTGKPRVWGPAPLELFSDDRPQELARYPNVDANGDNVWLDSLEGSSSFDVVYEGARPTDRAWSGIGDEDNPVMVHGYLHWSFGDGLSELLSIDTAKKRMTITPSSGGSGTVRKNLPYYVYNLLEELDAPGEYWLDHADGKLYFWPPTSAQPPENTWVSLLEQPIIEMVEASHVVLERLQIEIGRDRGVVISGGQNVVLDGCRVRNLGRDGVTAARGDDGPHETRHAFLNGEVYATGTNGITLDGGDLKTLVESGDRVSNSHIHRFGRLVGNYKNGVTLNGCGGRVEHALIEDGPSSCVRFGGAIQSVEHSILGECVKDQSDMGAIYYGYLSPFSRGNKIRFNVIENNYHRHRPWRGHGDGHFVPAIYVDNGGSGGDISMNLIRNADIGMFFNSGKFNHLVNNVLVDNKAPRRSMCKYKEPVPSYLKKGGIALFIDLKEDGTIGDQSIPDRLRKQNVCSWTDHADPWTPGESWASQLCPYDSVEKVRKPPISKEGYRSDGEFIGNINWRSGPHYEDAPHEGCDWSTDQNNLDPAIDPLFVDEDAGDFHLRPDSPAGTLLDPPFPVEDWNHMLDIVGPTLGAK